MDWHPRQCPCSFKEMCGKPEAGVSAKDAVHYHPNYTHQQDCQPELFHHLNKIPKMMVLSSLRKKNHGTQHEMHTPSS